MTFNQISQARESMSCKFCNDDHYPQNELFAVDFNGRIELHYDSGQTYDVPADLAHMIVTHSYEPPRSLITDVMNSRHVPSGAARAIGNLIKIDITELYKIGNVPIAFPFRLHEHIKQAMRPKI